MFGNVDDVITNNMLRRVFDNFAQWLPIDVWESADSWAYAVYKFPFVPGFHVCEIHDDDTPDGINDWEHILSSHRTLAEAMGVCKVLLANGGARYE